MCVCTKQDDSERGASGIVSRNAATCRVPFGPAIIDFARCRCSSVAIARSCNKGIVQQFCSVAHIKVSPFHEHFDYVEVLPQQGNGAQEWESLDIWIAMRAAGLALGKEISWGLIWLDSLFAGCFWQ